MYADKVTASMTVALGEMERRRLRQAAYNAEHGITPASVIRDIDDVLSSGYERDYAAGAAFGDSPEIFRTRAELDAELARLEHEMKAAAANMEFERAAALRDRLKALRTHDLGLAGPDGA
jgi:excinuclease ABC subunit B